MPKGSNPKSWANLKPGTTRKGVPNKATREIREFAQRILEDPEYVESLRRRLKKGTAGQVEALLFHYGYGKPKETLAVEGGQRPLIIDAVTPEDVQRRRIADDD